MDRTYSISVAGSEASLHAMLLDTELDGTHLPPQPAILILPGGGYQFTSDREAEPVARRFNAAGFHCFVLRYTVKPGSYPLALCQAAKSMEWIRAHADEWNIDPAGISVMGFSAGGHLAALLSVSWNRPVLAENDCTAAPSVYRPDAQILCYPVVTFGEHSHCDSYFNLLGKGRPDCDYEALAPHTLVNSDTPRAFLWATADDPLVPAENAMIMASALRKNGIPFELHIYENGQHGLSLCNSLVLTPAPDCAPWVDAAAAFLHRGHLPS